MINEQFNNIRKRVDLLSLDDVLSRFNPDELQQIADSEGRQVDEDFARHQLTTDIWTGDREF